MKNEIKALIFSIIAVTAAAGVFLPSAARAKIKDAADTAESITVKIYEFESEIEDERIANESESVSEETTTDEETVEPETTTAETTVFEPSDETEEDNHIYYDIPLSKSDQALTEDICEVYGIDHRIIFAQMQQESGFDRYCIGDGGKAIGILQIQPRWFEAEMKRLCCTDLTRVNESVWIACDFMSYLLNKYDGDYRCALTHYRYGDLTIDAEDYASIVMKFAEELKEEME